MTLKAGSNTTRKEIERQRTPWFTQYKKRFLEEQRFKKHELVNQPVAFAFILTHEDAQNPLGFIKNALGQLPPQYAEQIYNQSVKQFVFCLNDANSVTENGQLNLLINELKKGATYTFFQPKDICILPMSSRVMG